jgi:hypothetical protein
MARIPQFFQDQVKNPSKVLNEAPKFSQAMFGTWSAAAEHQAWTHLQVSAEQRVKITAGNQIMSGMIETHQSGELLLTIYAGAGESTVQLSGTWNLTGKELRLEFKATDMLFVQTKA